MGEGEGAGVGEGVGVGVGAGAFMSRAAAPLAARVPGFDARLAADEGTDVEEMAATNTAAAASAQQSLKRWLKGFLTWGSKVMREVDGTSLCSFLREACDGRGGRQLL